MIKLAPDNLYDVPAQQAWLESDQLGDAYEAIGAWKAELENACPRV